jgi:hypothetical protein
MCDRYVGGIFEKMGYSMLQKRDLFYTICIFIRLLMAGTVYNYSKNKYIQYAVIFFSIISTYLNYTKLNECVWWSRKFHLIIAFILLVVSLQIIFKKIKNTKLMAYLLYIDVLFGIVHTLKISPFNL